MMSQNVKHRPRYERPGDLKNERAVAEVLESRYGFTATKVHEYSGYDFDFRGADGSLKLRAEMKCRNIPMGKHNTYIVSKMKYEKLVKLAESDGITTALVVRWTDAIGVIPVPFAHKVIMGGRYDRGDDMDWEEMVEFPIKNFRIIKKF